MEPPPCGAAGQSPWRRFAWLLQIETLIMIIFAKVLLDQRIIAAPAFTALLLMAVASTMLTTPMVAPRLARLATTQGGPGCAD